MWTYAAFTTAAAGSRAPRRAPPRGLAGAGCASGCCAGGESGVLAKRAGVLCSRATTSGTATSPGCVNPRSRQWLSHMSTWRRLHPDFGPSYGDGPTTASRSPSYAPRTRRSPSVRLRERERPGRLPVRRRHPHRGRSELRWRHARRRGRPGRCRLYETWNTRERGGRWTAGSGATWSLKSNALRPDTWTSADAAGLPILPGLLRWNEVKAGPVRHAIRFTTDVTSRHHLWPARHDAGSQKSLAYPPMGARFRLKAASAHGLRHLRAPRDHRDEALRPGPRRQRLAVVLPGRAERAWPPALIEDLKRIPASAFVAVDTSRLMVAAESGASA